MPSMLEMSKDYVIESENDIPQKYREETINLILKNWFKGLFNK